MSESEDGKQPERISSRRSRKRRSATDEDSGTVQTASEGAIENQMESKIMFADYKAEIAWKIAEAVKEIAAGIPQEDSHMRACRIRFAPVNETSGMYAILFAGTVVWTQEVGVYAVPERTVSILDRLGIPYLTETH